MIAAKDKSKGPDGEPTLQGRRILVTRARDQGETLVRTLQSLGATVLWIPAIETVPILPENSEGRAIEELERFQWIAFTSTNTVRYFLGLLAEAGRSIPPQIRIAAVGAATERALLSEGLPVHERPGTATGLGLGIHLAEVSPPGRILVPRGRRGRRELAAHLEGAGWQVVSLACYDTVPVRLADTDIEAFREGIDGALFASPSQVHNFWSALDERDREVLKGALLVPIGPTTARALEELGLESAPLPGESTAEGMVNTLVANLK